MEDGERTSIRTDTTEKHGLFWRPIKTAPKDGRALVFFDPSRRDDPFQCGFWLLDPEGEHNHDGGWWLADGREAPHPTHWMPLPSPPHPSEKDS